MSAEELGMLQRLGLAGLVTALFITKPPCGKPVSASELQSLQLLGLEADVFTMGPVRGKKGCTLSEVLLLLTGWGGVLRMRRLIPGKAFALLTS